MTESPQQAADAQPRPLEPRRKGPVLWVLAVVSGALLLLNGALGYLLFDERRSSRADLAKIDQLATSVEVLEEANERSQGDIDELTEGLADDRALIEDLSACPAALEAYIDAGQSSDAEFEAAVDELIATCHLRQLIVMPPAATDRQN